MGNVLTIWVLVAEFYLMFIKYFSLRYFKAILYSHTNKAYKYLVDFQKETGVSISETLGPRKETFIDKVGYLFGREPLLCSLFSDAFGQLLITIHWNWVWLTPRPVFEHKNLSSSSNQLIVTARSCWPSFSKSYILGRSFLHWWISSERNRERMLLIYNMLGSGGNR